MKKMTPFFTVAGLALASSASAAILGVNVETNATPQGVANQIVVETDTDWTLAQLVLNLSSGALYQDAVGTDLSPQSLFLGAFPSLGNDTFLSAGSLFDDPPSSAGGAVDLGGAAVATMSGTQIDYAWFDTDTSDIGTSTIAQIAASQDATGTFQLLLFSEGGSTGSLFEGTVTNGVVNVVPEPPSLALLGLGGLLIARRRRG